MENTYELAFIELAGVVKEIRSRMVESPNREELESILDKLSDDTKFLMNNA